MSSLMRKVFRHLPESVRHYLIRRALTIPLVDADEFQFKIAQTREELEAAYALLHDCYAKFGLMKPHPSGLRCSLYSVLPYTTTIIAKRGNRVVGTVSLIKDSEIGFPSDKEYQAENDNYRAKGFRMIEVSALAVDPEFRAQGHLVSLNLMKYLYLYAMKYMDSDMLCATVHPRAWDFYAGILGFRKNGKVVNYGFVDGALAIHITLNLRWAIQWWPKVYRRPEGNLPHFFHQVESPFEFPKRTNAAVVDPVLTPENLEYFFVQKTSLFAELTERERALIRSAYALHFDVSCVPLIGEAALPDRAFRYLTRLRGVLKGVEGRLARMSEVKGGVMDLSTGGLFFETSEILQLGRAYRVRLILDDEGIQELKLLCVPKWRNEGVLLARGSLRHPVGYGMAFLVDDIRVAQYLKLLHPHSVDESAAEESKALTSIAG